MTSELEQDCTGMFNWTNICAYETRIDNVNIKLTGKKPTWLAEGHFIPWVRKGRLRNNCAEENTCFHG